MHSRAMRGVFGANNIFTNLLPLGNTAVGFAMLRVTKFAVNQKVFVAPLTA